MCGNECLDSSANLFMEMPLYNEDTADALVEILFLITAIPYGFPKVRVYLMKIPFKHFFLERRLLSFRGKSQLGSPSPSWGGGCFTCLCNTEEQ